jgi:hypothetical protein
MVASSIIIFQQEKLVMEMYRSRRIRIILALFLTLFATVTVSAADKPNFSGTWKLDKEKSTNLPRLFEAVDEYFLLVNQTGENSITFSTRFTGRGQTISNEAETFPTDGSAVEKEDRRGVKTRRTVRFDTEKPRLLVETERRFTGEIQMANTNDNEVWELSDEGKTLTVTITPKAEGGQQQVRVFSRSQE